LHRIRRSRLNPFFSRKKVLELEDIVQSKSKKLCLLISEKFTAGLSFDLHHALRAISIDIITDYAFNQPYNLLDEDDLGANFSVMMRELASIIWIFQQWPILRRLSLSLPDSLVAKLSSSVNSILQLRKVSAHFDLSPLNLTKYFTVQISREQLLTVKADLDSGIARAGSRTTIFHDLLTPNAAEGYTVPPVNDLQDEVYTVIGAAAESTGNAMTVAAYHVISNANIYQKLTEELRAEFPDPTPPLSLVVLEKLPYLVSALIRYTG
jgi:cytochrome P450